MRSHLPQRIRLLASRTPHPDSGSLGSAGNRAAPEPGVWHANVKSEPESKDLGSPHPGYAKPLVVGTDCSGMEVPIMALKNMNINFRHAFSCDNDKHSKDFVRKNFSPK